MIDRTEDRIDNLQRLYVEDEINAQLFEELCEAALKNEPPFHADWFLKQRGVSPNDPASEESWWLYCGQKYVLDGQKIVPYDD